MSHSFQMPPLRTALVVLVLNASMALAQASFDDGSFDAATPTAPPVPAPPAPAGGGFDDGSFDAGGTPAAPQPPTPPKPPAAPQPAVTPQPPPGGADFDDGSFEPNPAPPIAGGVTPAPAPAPQPQPAPAPLAPAPPNPAPPIPAPTDIAAEIAAFEMRDFGIPPTDQLRSGQFHAPTPTAIPGAQVVGTDAVAQAMGNGTNLVLIDVLGGQYSLPNAYMAPALAQGGNFQDRIQQQASQWLGQITGGDPSRAVVIYCSDPSCWLSYNAALRVVAAGYTNVYWYRGGIQAWQMAGLQLSPSGF